MYYTKLFLFAISKVNCLYLRDQKSGLADENDANYVDQDKTSYYSDTQEDSAVPCETQLQQIQQAVQNAKAKGYSDEQIKEMADSEGLDLNLKCE